MHLLVMDLNALWKKLGYKEQSPICVLNAPDSFRPALSHFAAPPLEVVHPQAQYTLFFCITQKDLDTAAHSAANLPEGDVLVWVAYPKKSSRNYACEFDRDHGWQSFGNASFEGVRIVAIDQDWSALRMRRISYIKNFTRSNQMALSPQGKARTNKPS